MLCYKRIDNLYFINTFFPTKKDTFFATKKTNKLSRGNTYMQLFVTDNSYVHAVPMKSKAEAPAALKQIAKEIGAYASGEQTSQKVKIFLQQIGTSLCVLGKDTQWTNGPTYILVFLKRKLHHFPFGITALSTTLVPTTLLQKTFSNYRVAILTSYHTTGREGDISNYVNIPFTSGVTVMALPDSHCPKIS
jgi:hypothetical protein